MAKAELVTLLLPLILYPTMSPHHTNTCVHHDTKHLTGLAYFLKRLHVSEEVIRNLCHNRGGQHILAKKLFSLLHEHLNSEQNSLLIQRFPPDQRIYIPRCKARDLYTKIHAYLQQGFKPTQITQYLGVDYKTVKRAKHKP